MGCACSRDDPISIEDDCFAPFEQSLKLANKSADSFIMILKKHSISNTLNLEFLENPLISNVLDLIKHYRFYKQFQTNKRYDTKKLCCLAILIGKGSPTTKSELLYDLFKDEDSDCFTKNNLEATIECILSISCELIPNYVSSLHPDNTKLKDYAQNIKLIFRGTGKELVKDFLFCERLSVKEGFVWRFVGKLDYLLSSRKTREFCYAVYEWALRPVENALKTVGDEETGDSNMGKFKSFTPKSKSKRHDSNLV